MKKGFGRPQKNVDLLNSSILACRGHGRQGDKTENRERENRGQENRGTSERKNFAVKWRKAF
jgi:hypothetical protein